MRLLTKLELDKLIRRKYLLLGGLLLLGYSSFMFFSCCMNSSPTFPVETADGVEVTGRAAALYNKSVYEQYAGELTDEAVAHVLDDFVDLRDAHGEHSFNWPVIYDNFSIFRAADQADRKRSEYGYISVADAGVLSFHSPLVFSFDYTWQTAFNILFNSNVVFAIFLLIVLAPVFSEEYSSGAANVILSTRYGKSKVIQAKFTAAFLIAAISAVIFCVVILLACGAYFAGFEGWNADIQTQFMSNQSQIPIRMNNLQFFLVVMLFYWLSAVGTAVLACCCSALKVVFSATKNSLSFSFCIMGTKPTSMENFWSKSSPKSSAPVRSISA